MINSTSRLVALSALVLFVAACSSNAAEPDETVAEGSQASEETLGTEEFSQARARLGDGEVPVLSQLMIGTLRLEGTDQAVDSAQAAELVPLWKALRSLTISDIAAEAEIEAVINQIQGTMSANQIEEISAFEINPDDMRSII